MRRIRALIALALLAGCTSQKPPALHGPSPSARFRNVAEEAGLTFSWKPTARRPLTILQTIGNGAAFVDFDNDGSLDLFLVGPRPALYRGDGKGRFVDVSAPALGNLTGAFLGVAVGDYDNDGFPDLYVTGYRDGRLLHNEQGRRLVDATATAGLPPQPWGTSASWVDLDSDGWLDLVVLNYLDFGPQTRPQLCTFPSLEGRKIPSACGPRYYAGKAGVVFQNRRGRFADATRPWGFRHAGKGLGIAAADLSGDGQMSLAVANDEAEGNLFVAGAGGRLHDIAVEAGTARDRDGNLHAGMGIDWGDYDNDGRLDFALTTFRNEAKSLYRHLGGSLFDDVAYPAGIGRTAFPLVAFGVKFVDADNDGWLDLLMASGHIQDNVEQLENTTYRQPLLFLKNQGASGKAFFDDATQASGLAAVGDLVGRGVATGDYDNDGKVDALVVDSEGAPRLLHNETPSAGHWLILRLESAHGGRAAYGARVRATLPSGKTLLRHCQSDGSYLSASDSRVHLGLGSATKVTVTVRWPGGKTATFPDLAVDRLWRLREKESRALP